MTAGVGRQRVGQEHTKGGPRVSTMKSSDGGEERTQATAGVAKQPQRACWRGEPRVLMVVRVARHVAPTAGRNPRKHMEAVARSDWPQSAIWQKRARDGEVRGAHADKASRYPDACGRGEGRRSPTT